MSSPIPVPLLVAACGALFFAGHALEESFRRWRIPDVLPLIALGALCGPLLGWLPVEPDGTALHLLSHITLILILFHGGYELRLEELRAGAWPALRTSVVLMILSAMVAAGVARWVAGLDTALAVLFGVAVAPVAATVAIPMLEHLGFDRALRTAVTLETALGDVVGLVGVVTLTGIFMGRSNGVGQAAGQFVSSLLVAGALGAGCAVAWSLLLSRIQQFGKTVFATEAALLIVAGLSSWLGFSDAIAALTFGIALQNLDTLPAGALKRLSLSPAGLNTTEEKLLNEAVFIVKVFFFFALGLMLKFDDAHAWGIAGAVVAGLAVVRLLGYRSLLNAGGDRRQEQVAASLFPRGLASAVAATVPVAAGLSGADGLRDLVYAVIPLSVVATTASVAWFGRGGPTAAEPGPG